MAAGSASGLSFFLRTIGFNLAIGALNNFTQLWPPGEVLQIEANVVCFSEVVQVARIELEQIHWGHRPERHHSRQIWYCRIVA